MQILLARLTIIKQKEYLGNVLYLQIFWALSAGSIAALLIHFSNLNQVNNKFILATMITVTATLCQDYIRRTYIIKNKLLNAVIHDSFVSILQLLSLIIIYFTQASLPFCLFAIGCSYIPSVIVGIYKSERSKLIFSEIKSTFIKNWGYSKWLVATSTLQIFSGNYLLLLAPSYLGVAVLGSIRLAQNLIGILNVVLQAFDNYVPVTAAKLYSVETNKSYKYLTKISLQAAALIFTILILVYMTASPIFSISGGSSYEGNAYILQGFCFVYFFMFAGYPMRILLRLQERTHHIFIAYVLASVSNLAFAKYILENFGVIGLLVSLSAIQCIMLIYMSLVLLINKKQHANYSLHIR
ncbi:MAG: lipopolysaccharide biosynthesis protein [Chitinophagales bacterium]